jgi:hypothetical protein
MSYQLIFLGATFGILKMFGGHQNSKQSFLINYIIMQKNVWQIIYIYIHIMFNIKNIRKYIHLMANETNGLAP